MEVQRFDPDHFNVRAGLHAHRFCELLLATTGEGCHTVDGRMIELRAGHVIALAPGAAHDCRANGTLEGWLIMFTPDVLSPSRPGGQDPRWAVFADPGRSAPNPLDVGVSARRALEAKITAIDALQRTDSRASELAADAWLNLLLLDLHGLADPVSGPVPTPSDDLCTRVLRYIDQEFSRGLSLAAVASAFDLSPSHLTGRVRAETGLTVQRWIIERRLTEARKLLVDSDASLATIAAAAGYLDVPHFTRQFRRAHGMPPGRWRARQAPGDLPSRP